MAFAMVLLKESPPPPPLQCHGIRYGAVERIPPPPPPPPIQSLIANALNASKTYSSGWKVIIRQITKQKDLTVNRVSNDISF